MKYIEELIAGNTFVINDNIFLLTSDFKKDGSKLAYSIIGGNAKWFKASDIVDIMPIYHLDEQNNVAPIQNFPVASTTIQ